MISKLLSISKKTAWLLMLCLGTCQLTSCLDENPRDRLTEEEAFDNAENLFINAVVTLYKELMEQILEGTKVNRGQVTGGVPGTEQRGTSPTKIE